jgi:hypothetical protein
MPESKAILKELRGLREQVRAVADDLRLLLIYAVDPGATLLPERGAETKGRLHADDSFVQEHRRAVLRMPAKGGR